MPRWNAPTLTQAAVMAILIAATGRFAGRSG